MKKITLLFFLFLSAVALGQHRVVSKVKLLNESNAVFIPFAPLTVSNRTISPDVAKVVDNATMAEINRAVLKKIGTMAPETIELSIPYKGNTIIVQLYKSEIFAQGFHADTDKQTNFKYHPGLYYRGIIKGNENSLASFSFFEDEISGIISSQSLHNLVIGHLPQERDKSAYIIYSDAELNILHNFSCGTSELPASNKSDSDNETFSGQTTDHCVTIYFEIDHDIYLEQGSSQQETANWITGLFNNIHTLYDNDGITVSLKSFKIWTTPDSYFGAEAEDYLNAFYTVYFNEDFDGDVGQLVAMDPGALGGIAPLEGLCQEDAGRNISYVDISELGFEPVPLYSWRVHSMTHELGHVFGSRHTHSCVWNGNNTPIDSCGSSVGFGEDGCTGGPIPEEGGTIMSYCHLTGVGVNFANGFGPQPSEKIKDFINNANCLGTSCAAQSCHSFITNFNVNSISSTTASFSWSDEASGPWEISHHASGGQPTPWEQAVASSVTLQGLEPNTFYTFEVRTVCDQSASQSFEVMFGTDAVNSCDGLTFSDPSGTTGFYNTNEHMIRTFTSPDVDSKVKVVFSDFDLEENFDFFYVYDGPNTTAPLIGQFTGSAVPGPFVSSLTGGSLTFEFISDNQVNSLGWIAEVSCESALATDDNSFANFSYFPNPANSDITIACDEILDQIVVYNAAGQLLLSQTSSSATVTLDISSLAAGVYFLKATGGTKETHFTIVKQ